MHAIEGALRKSDRPATHARQTGATDAPTTPATGDPALEQVRSLTRSCELGAIEGITDINNHPPQPGRITQKGVAAIGAGQEIMDDAMYVWQPLKIWLVKRPTGYRDSLLDSVRRPVCSPARVRSRTAN